MSSCISCHECAMLKRKLLYKDEKMAEQRHHHHVKLQSLEAMNNALLEQLTLIAAMDTKTTLMVTKEQWKYRLMESTDAAI